MRDNQVMTNTKNAREIAKRFTVLITWAKRHHQKQNQSQRDDKKLRKNLTIFCEIAIVHLLKC